MMRAMRLARPAGDANL